MPGLPVRLVRRDGKEIRLDCTDYMVQVNRMVRSTPIPFTGERFGGDLNMVTTSIRLNVVLQDDNCAEVSAETSGAVSYIDCNKEAVKLTGLDFLPVAFMKADGGTMTRALLNDTVLEISARGSSGEPSNLKITLKDASGTSTGYDSNQTEMILNMKQPHSGDSIAALVDAEPTGAELATFIQSYIAGNTTFADLVTATVSSAGVVKLVNVNKGLWNEENPTFTTAGDVAELLVITFSGGSAQSCYSAGDKVQNLLGSVANNTILGGVGSIFGAGGKGGMLNLDYDFLNNQNDPSYESDYIIGLLLPYNSLVGVTAGIQQKDSPQSYVPRNFFYATGFSEGDKGADANIEYKASTEFNVGDKYSGIRGTVTAVEFKYNAGSSVYEGSVTFGPMDAIVGI